MELDNLTLAVIPELRLTNRGLVDVRAGTFVDVSTTDWKLKVFDRRRSM